MVGVEVRRYGSTAQVAELARRLGIPVVTTFMGRGLLTDTGDVPWPAPTWGWPATRSRERAGRALRRLLLLGVIVSDTNFAVSARRIDFRHAMVVFDGDVRDRPPRLPRAAAGRAGRRAARALPARPAASGAPRCTAAGPAPSTPQPVCRTTTRPSSPADIAAPSTMLMRRHGPMPIASDVGDCLFTAMACAHRAAGARLLRHHGLRRAGRLGLQVATGQRPLILVGDGAFQMTGWELGNAARSAATPSCCCSTTPAGRCCAPSARRAASTTWRAGTSPRWPPAWAATATRCTRAPSCTPRCAARTPRAGASSCMDIHLAPGRAVAHAASASCKAVKRLSMPD
jgi:indolepyruvate decarboxylase